jgi:alpha-glucosidase
MFAAAGFSLLVMPLALAQVCDDVYPHLSAGLRADTEEKCISFGCCWDSSAGSCFVPKIEGYSYKEINSDDSSVTGDLVLHSPSGAFGPDFEILSVDFVQETPNRMHMKIAPKEGGRWEVPEDVFPRPGGASKMREASMQTHIIPDPFQFAIRRSKSTQDLFYMSKMLVFQDQYIQFVLGTPNNTVATFGFGESTRASQQVEVDKTYSMWATDFAAGGGFDNSLYGSHPFFIQVLDDGTAHGALILNSNAMEASSHADPTGQQGNTIGVQIAGGLIDIYFFSGNSPTEVLQYYQEVIGRPMLTPYWSLGFHNCKWGYESLAEVEAVVANYSAAQIPLETQWVDIDYMDHFLDFTVDPTKFPAGEMAAFVADLTSKDMHFVPIVDPGIYAELDESNPYDALVKGLEQDVFIKDTTGEKLFMGQVWPGNTYFPDWFASNATSYWKDQLVRFHDLVAYSGIWIDMNEVRVCVCVCCEVWIE